MEKQLGQSEIDALFAANSAGSVAQPVEGPRDHEVFDFSRSSQITTEQMRAIALVNDAFARNLMHTLGAWLRAEFAVKLVAGEQMPYRDFLERLVSPSFVCSIRLEPSGAIGLLEWDLALAYPMIDVLLGGPGRSSSVRELTDIEETILSSVMQIVAKELNGAWESVGLTFLVGKKEVESQVARLMTGSEKTVCMSYEVNVTGAVGSLTLCLPANVLNASLRKVVERGERPKRRNSEAKQRMRELLAELSFPATLQFPKMQVNARDLNGLQPGVLLKLPATRETGAEMRWGGLMICAAQPVRVGDQRGVRIEGAATRDSQQRHAAS